MYLLPSHFVLWQQKGKMPVWLTWTGNAMWKCPLIWTFLDSLAFPSFSAAPGDWNFKRTISIYIRASLVAQWWRIHQATQVQPLGQEAPLEKEMATHFTVLAWRIPWREEPGGLQSVWSQRFQHDLATEQEEEELSA